VSARASVRWRLGALALGAGLLGAAGARADALAPGAKVFETHCVMCHQAGGKGQPGMAPPLAGVLAPALAQADGVRYVTGVLLNGLSGRIVSQGQTYMLAMAPKRDLTDQELADVANYVAQGLNATATASFKPADFEQARARTVGHKELLALRKQLLP